MRRPKEASCSPTLTAPETTPLTYLDNDSGSEMENSSVDQGSAQDPWHKEDPWHRSPARATEGKKHCAEDLRDRDHTEKLGPEWLRRTLR